MDYIEFQIKLQSLTFVELVNLYVEARTGLPESNLPPQGEDLVYELGGIIEETIKEVEDIFNQ